MVKRWHVHEAFRMEDGLIVERKVGNSFSSNPDVAFVDVILASDYDALAARLAEAEAAAKTWENEAERRSRRYEQAAVQLAEAECGLETIAMAAEERVAAMDSYMNSAWVASNAREALHKSRVRNND